VGIDIVHEDDIAPLIADNVALKRTFSALEIAECAVRVEDSVAAYARRFAAKEALIKACGTPVGHFSAIEIVSHPGGGVSANWSVLIERGLNADVSISSSRGTAVAVAIVWPAEGS
jgi:phosphopantetheine--protein transferase-like protein